MATLNYINGEWLTSSSNATLKNVNPSKLTEEIGEFQNSNEKDVELAFESAAAAKRSWAALSPLQRAEYLYQAANILESRLDEVAKTLANEVGKTIDEATGEVKRGVNILRYYAGEGYRAIGENIPPSDPNGFMYTTRIPLGVVAVITPWNFPCAIPLWKMAPALIFGNTVVFKPAKEASITGLKIVKCFHEAGLPKGVLNAFTGEGRVLGDVILNNEHLNGVTFTGSNSVGKRIGKISYDRGVKYQLELGGKNPIVVTKNADLDEATKGIVNGAFKFTGQKCTATSRIYIEEAIYDEVKEKVISSLQNIKVGEAISTDSFMGPSSNKNQYNTVVSYIEAGKAEGATVLHGGNYDPSKGYYIEPTLFEVNSNNLKIVKEEIFGPVTTMMKVKDLEEAIQFCNESEYGLSASLYSRQLDDIQTFIREIEVGMVRVNSETSGVELQAPFGGLKESSSFSREQGRAAIEFYTSIKTIFIR